MKNVNAKPATRFTWGEYGLESIVWRDGFASFQKAISRAARKAHFQWLVTLQGSARVRVRDQHYYLRSGTLYGSDQFKDAIFSKESEDFEFVLVQFSGTAAAKYNKYLVSHYGHYHLDGLDDALRRCVDSIAKRRLQSADLTEDWLEGYEFFCLLHERLSSIAVAPRRILELNPDGEELMALSRYSMSELAALQGYSSSQLSRKLKERWGENPSKVLQLSRLKKGARLLLTSDLSVSDIASAIGYGSDIAFCNAFKKSYDVSPAAYRHQGRAKGQADQESISVSEGSAKRDRYRIRFGPFFQMSPATHSFSPPQSFDLRFFSSWKSVTINLTLIGESILDVGNERIHAGPGTIIIHPRPMKGQYRRVESCREFYSVSLHTQGDLAYDYLRWLTRAYGFVYRAPLDNPILHESKEFLGLVTREHVKITYTEMSYKFGRWLRGLQDVARQYLDTNEGSRVSIFDFEMFDAIEARTFQEYAGLLGYSRSHLSRKMSKLSEATPHRVFYQTKYHLALRLVAETDLPIKDIAVEHLKMSQRVFNYAFKRWTSMTPTEFRKLHR